MSNMSVGEENKDGVCRHAYPHFFVYNSTFDNDFSKQNNVLRRLTIN